MASDRGALLRLQRQLGQRHRQGRPCDRLAARLQEGLRRSRQEVERRRGLVPAIAFPPELPVSARRDAIAEALTEHQVVIVSGETGSGKTTQLPKLCLAQGRGVRGRIGHTQPRRIAATTVARRIDEELGGGGLVGFQVRFDDRSGPDTLVKLMTDGILLAEIQRDRQLNQYDTLIIDEAHERSLNIDFLLGYLKQLLPSRPDLKLIITSATIDVASFSRHFGDAPVIDVSGRGYPVDVHYLPPLESAGGDLAEQLLGACDYLRQLEASGSGYPHGDILVFLPGERDIRDCALALRRDAPPDWDILPLYARLGRGEQERVFDLSRRRGRRVVLATNVAETSLTVPGIRYVIDSGLARVSRYSHRSRVQRLPIEPVARSSAEQRKGRCGRIAPGLCLRLYSEEDYAGRPAFTDSEIHRTNLAAVILQLCQLRFGAIDRFPFIEPPDSRLVRDGYRLLEELGAIEAGGELTDIGRALARMPVDPRLGRMVLAAAGGGCLAEVLVIVAALSLPDPRERPLDRQQAADQAHARFVCPTSDFMSLVALWDYFESQRQALSRNQLRKLCQREFLSLRRLYEWRDVHHQLRLVCQELGLRASAEPATEESIHRALLAGLASHVGQREERREYRGTHQRRWQLFPGTALRKKPPEWVVAAELVETGQLYARTAGRIEPDWVIEVVPQLLRRSYSEPHFSQRRGAVVALETVSLYGLILSDRRRVAYGPLDPELARELFIRGALVEGGYRGRAAFWRHNRALIAEVQELETRFRRPDLLVEDEVIYRFYAERIPAGIFSVAAFDKWRKSAEREEPALLQLSRERLLRRDPGAEVPAQFPDTLSVDELQLPLRYRFEPGGEADGVTASVPLMVLRRLPRARFDWLVPGMLRDKCIELVKGLPKALRKGLVPVPDSVDRALARMSPGDEPLTRALGAALAAQTGVVVPAEAWRPEALDPFYAMHFEVLGEEGQVLARGRDLDALAQQLGDRIQAAVRSLEPAGAASAVHTRWDFGPLEDRRAVTQGGLRVEVFPALVDRGDGVALELMDERAEAAASSRAGVARLAMLALPDKVKYLRKHWLRGNALSLQLGSLGERSALVDDLLQAVFSARFAADDTLPTDEAAFRRAVREGQGGLIALGEQYHARLQAVIALHHRARQGLGRLDRRVWQYAIDDMEGQLAELLGEGFLRGLRLERLEQYPRYLEAVVFRIDKLAGHEQKDRQATAEVARQVQRLREARAGGSATSEGLERFRWLLEEYRVSLFAQRLGTREPVSGKRLDRLWQSLGGETAEGRGKNVNNR